MYKLVKTKGLYGLFGLFLGVFMLLEPYNSPIKHQHCHDLILNSSPVAGSSSIHVSLMHMLMHNSLSSSSCQSGRCGDITRPLSESKLAFPPLAPTAPHYQQPTSSLQCQTSATPPPTSSISHTHTRTEFTGKHLHTHTHTHTHA